MQAYCSGDIQVSQLVSPIGGVHWNEMGNLGQTVNDDPDGVMTSVGSWKSGDKIHPDFIPFPLGNFQGLKESSGSLMFSFDLLTHITLGYERANYSLHPMLPKFLTKILVQFGSTRVNGVRGLMGFL